MISQDTCFVGSFTYGFKGVRVWQSPGTGIPDVSLIIPTIRMYGSASVELTLTCDTASVISWYVVKADACSTAGLVGIVRCSTDSSMYNSSALFCLQIISSNVDRSSLKSGLSLESACQHCSMIK